MVSGQLLDGTEFSTSDCIRLVPPGTPGAVAVSSNLPGIWVGATPLDEHLDGGGFTAFSRTYPVSTEVPLSAPLHPENHPGWVLDRWYVNGVPMPAGTTTMTFPVALSVHSMQLIYCDGQPCPCPCDLDGSSVVGMTDFLRMLAAWGANPGHSADFDGNDAVGVTDFLILLANWGPCP